MNKTKVSKKDKAKQLMIDGKICDAIRLLDVEPRLLMLDRYNALHMLQISEGRDHIKATYTKIAADLLYQLGLKDEKETSNFLQKLQAHIPTEL